MLTSRYSFSKYFPLFLLISVTSSGNHLAQTLDVSKPMHRSFTYTDVLGNFPDCQSSISVDDVSNVIYDLDIYFSSSTQLTVTLAGPSLGRSLMPLEYESTRHIFIFFCGLLLFKCLCRSHFQLNTILNDISLRRIFS